jgi:hypothetical protein
VTYTRVTLIKMAFSEDHGRRILDQILASEGLAHIAENFFDQLDGESLENCELVCKSWRQFIINNGLKFWKKQYLQKLAKPGTDAHRLIKSNPKLFQYFDQGTFHIFTRAALHSALVYHDAAMKSTFLPFLPIYNEACH